MNTETRDPNLFVYLTYQNNEGGTIGIAWVGVVCYSGKGYRVGISEYFNSDLRTAEVYIISKHTFDLHFCFIRSNFMQVNPFQKHLFLN